MKIPNPQSPIPKILLLFRIIEFNLNIQFFNFIKLKFKKRCLGN